MNIVLNLLNKRVKLLMINIVLLLISCGGGGGGDSKSAPVVDNTPTVATTPPPTDDTPPLADYTPDPNRLLTTATSSAELYVEPSFNFTSHQQVIFDIDVTDIDDNPIDNLLLTVSLINSEIVEHDDPRLQEKSLLTKVKTDNNGQIYFDIELSKSVDKVLLELNVLGIENEVIASIDESGLIAHHFRAN